MIRVCIIGAGNISNTRHIPALLKNEKEYKIVGVISDEEKKIKRTQKKYKFLSNTLVIDIESDICEQLMKCEWFMKHVDAVIIGVPPKQHYQMTKACLMMDKHVLVEKPMMMNVEQCEEVLRISKGKRKILNIMHSFQFSDGMKKLNELYKNGKLGTLSSILELQLSNRDRRLPVWYNDLPLGLFYDEAAHFFYSARKFGGELKVLNVHAQFNNKKENTPRFLQAQMKAGETPVQMYMNFNSPICEWALILICDEKIAIYDYFKDILIVLKNDGRHLAKDVLRNSLSFCFQFWKGFIQKGFKMMRGNLLYGHDACIEKFASEIKSGKICYELSGELGKEVVQAMNEVVDLAESER